MIMPEKKLMLGNEAVARGCWECGVHSVNSYPGTPSTEITEECAKYPREDILCEWAPNEKVALEVSFGVCQSGARALSCMKHVGLNVAADPLFTAAYTGVRGGLVIAVADDPAMHSSQNEQDSRYYARSAHLPMLEPADAQECKDFTKLAYEISEKYDTPVLLRLTTRLSHSRSVVTLEDRVKPEMKPYEKDAQKYVMMPGMAKKRHLVVEDREKRLAADACEMPVNREEIRGTELGVICSGVCYQYVREALPEASTLKLGLVNPLPRGLIESFAKKVKRLAVIEELEGVIEDQIAAWGVSVEGKNLTGVQGELSVNRIRAAFGLASPESAVVPEGIPARPPVLCPGCPHRGAFYVMKQMKLTVYGDIGCYTMAALPPMSSMDACLCMGASVGMSFGAEKALGRDASRRTVAVLGDSTFVHSGITPLIDSVYNGGHNTVCILDNRITGMTGHQQNPASGKNIYNEPAAQLNLEALCASCGVKDIHVVDPFDLKKSCEELQKALDFDGVSVVIFRRPCRLLLKGETKSASVDGCRNCGKCLTLGCPAIEKGENGVRINPALCVNCGLCAPLCAFGAIKSSVGGENK